MTPTTTSRRGGFVRRLLDAMRRQRQARALHDLPDYLLRDIGLRRDGFPLDFRPEL